MNTKAYKQALNVAEAFLGNSIRVGYTPFVECERMVAFCGYPEGDIEQIAEALYDILKECDG